MTAFLPITLRTSTIFDVELYPGRQITATNARVYRLERRLQRQFGIQILAVYIRANGTRRVEASLRIQTPNPLNLQEVQWLLVGMPEVFRITLSPRNVF